MSYHEEVLLGPKKLLPKLHSIMDIVSSFYFSKSVSLFSISKSFVDFVDGWFSPSGYDLFFSD